ncbi:MAG: mechanosensitive ion channel family protein [Candidatus Woesearchaeota archaeon]
MDIVNFFLHSKVLLIGGIAIITIISANFVNSIMRRAYAKTTSNLYHHRFHFGCDIPIMDQTKFNMARRIIVSTIYIIGILLIVSTIPELKEISHSIFVGAGVIALIVGFATQKIFANFVAGIFISMFEPFRIGDRIKIAGELGFVEDITLWHTSIRTLKNKRLMIPNGIIAEEKVVNDSISDEKKMNFIDFTISYDSEIDLAKKIIAEEVVKDPLFIDNKSEHLLLPSGDLYRISLDELGDYGMRLRLFVWTANATDGYFLKCSLYEKIKKRFDKEGIKIPYPTYIIKK